MKLLLPILGALLLCCPAWGSIARQGSCSGTTACTPSSAAIGAVEYAFAYNSGSLTAPTVPTDGCRTDNVTEPCWQTVFTQRTSSGTAGVLVVACRVDLSATSNASGTFTNASNLGIVSYTGTGARTTADCGLNLIPIGGNAATFENSSSTVTFNGITMSDGSGNSWVVAAMGDSITGNVCTPGGLTNVPGATTGFISVDDTNGAVAGLSTLTCNPATGSTTWVSQVFEIVVRQSVASIPSQLFQAYQSLSNFDDSTETGNHFTFIAPDASPAGNFIGLEIDWALPNGCAAATSCEPTITDCRGHSGCSGATLNTYTVAEACTNAAQGVGQEIAYATSVSFGTQSFDIFFSGYGPVIQNFHLKYINLKGIAASSPIDGSPVCNEGQIPSTNTLTNVSAGSITTTQNGDIIWATSTSQNPHGSNLSQDIVPGTGVLLTGLVNFMNAAQELYVQPSSGAINPSFGFEQTPATAYDNFGTMAIALKMDNASGSGYSGMHILAAQQDAAQGTAFQRVVFPCTGNLCLIVGASGSANSDSITAVNSFPSQTWNEINAATDQGFVWYAANASADASMNLVALVTTTTGVETNIFEINVLNAAGSPVDTSATCGGSSSSDAAHGTCYNKNGNGIPEIGQATSTSITLSQTTIPLIANSSCTNGDSAMLDTGTSTEVVHIISGCGTSNLTVMRADGSLPYYYTSAVSHEGSVYFIPVKFNDAPTIKPSTANGLVVLYENQGIGPPASLNGPAQFLQVWYQGEQDNSRLGDGDGIGIWYPASNTWTSITWNTQNGAAGSPSSTGTTWQAGATSFLAAGGGGTTGTQPKPHRPVVLF